jgi:hypothetical protein
MGAEFNVFVGMNSQPENFGSIPSLNWFSLLSTLRFPALPVSHSEAIRLSDFERDRNQPGLSFWTDRTRTTPMRWSTQQDYDLFLMATAELAITLIGGHQRGWRRRARRLGRQLIG